MGRILCGLGLHRWRGHADWWLMRPGEHFPRHWIVEWRCARNPCPATRFG